MKIANLGLDEWEHYISTTHGKGALEDSILYRKELLCQALQFKHCQYNQAQRHMDGRISVQEFNGRAMISDYLKGINFGYVGE